MTTSTDQMRQAKAEVSVETDRPHGLPPIMLVHLGGVDREKPRQDRRNVELLVERSGENELVILCELGTAGRKKWIQWNARVLPEQIDNLISVLTVARKNLSKLGQGRRTHPIKNEKKIALTDGGQGNRVAEDAPPISPITELTTWTEPTRFLLVHDDQGITHGHIQWLESEVTESFTDALQTFREAVIRNPPPPLRIA